jgi:glycosyltransferase involved in cell wall biosynthesis
MKRVLMLGPAPASRGGMASVIATLLAHGYGQHDGCRFIATQVDGGPARKAGQALLALAQVAALLACGRVALLHVHVASGASFWRKAVFIAAARLAGCPVLLHLHGGQFQQFIEQRLGRRRRRLALALMRGARAAFALSAESAALLRAYCPRAAVEVFPNPVGGAAPPPRAPDASVLFLGRLAASKGVFDLLHAFARVRAACPQARLVLAGDGDPAPLRALAGRLGLDAALSLPGWVDGAGRAALLAGAGVFVLPSHHEQLPISLLEAMAAGVPVVASAVGAVPALLAHGRYGTLVRAGNRDELAAAILKMLQDKILAEKFSARGLERVKSDYHVEKVLARLRRRYEELLE